MNNLEITITNLTLLRDGIKAAIDRSSLVLDMKTYRRGIFREDENPLGIIQIDNLGGVNSPECGSSCCVLGFSPSIPGLEAIEDDCSASGLEAGDGGSIMSYDRYSVRMFPYLDVDGQTWEYLFGAINDDDVDDFVRRADTILVKWEEA